MGHNSLKKLFLQRRRGRSRDFGDVFDFGAFADRSSSRQIKPRFTLPSDGPKFNETSQRSTTSSETEKAVGRSPVGCPPSMARSYHRVGLAPMAAEIRLPTSSDSATCLVPSVFHTVRTSTPRLFSYSLPTNRQLTGRDLFEVFWLLEHEHASLRRLL